VTSLLRIQQRLFSIVIFYIFSNLWNLENVYKVQPFQDFCPVDKELAVPENNEKESLNR